MSKGIWTIVACTLLSVASFGQVRIPGPGGGTGSSPVAATPTFAPQSGSYAGIPQINITSASGCSSYIVYNTSGAQSGGNLTGTTSGTSYGISATVTLYAQVQSCPGYTNSAISNQQYIVLGTATVLGTETHLSTTTTITNFITTGSDAAGYTLVATSVYGQEYGSAGNVVTALYNYGTGTQTLVASGSSAPVAFNGTAQWLTSTYSASLGQNTNLSLAFQTSQFMNFWYGSGVNSLTATGLTYPTWPSSLSFSTEGSFALSMYIVVTPN